VCYEAHGLRAVARRSGKLKVPEPNLLKINRAEAH
jgi:hypothetical protein